MRDDGFGLLRGEDLSKRPAGGHLRTKEANERARGGDPETIAAFAKGAEGEEIVGSLLASLPGDEWHVLHSIPLESIGDVDHLVIGPPGLVVINTKNHTGRRVVVGADGLRVDGVERDHLSQIGRQGRVVANHVRDVTHLSVPTVAVVAVVVSKTADLEVWSSPADVLAVASESLVETLASLEVRQTQTESDQLFEMLRRADAWLLSATTRPSSSGAKALMPRGRAPRVRSSSSSSSSSRSPRGGRAPRWWPLVSAALAILIVLAIANLARVGMNSLATLAADMANPQADADEPVASGTSETEAESVAAVMPTLPNAEPLYGKSELARFLEASLVAGETSIDVSYWVESGGLSPDGLDDAVAAAASRNPYAYVDSWTTSESTVSVEYVVGPISLSSQQIRTRMAAESAADEVESLAGPGASKEDVRHYLDEILVIDEHATSEGDTPEARLIASPDEAFGALRYGIATERGYRRALNAIVAQLGE
ncbi:nuclease-related domain-containing protein [Demequina rhizosphaerae]|uniref:nuclease-related domain-containing protein n=1 Tax=Demequina rhizosphaerae TaxID=1638985 RepID=UPI0007864C0C|nr:nuclease-related domain-containing protein [Demequina rhizosphaerae]